MSMTAGKYPRISAFLRRVSLPDTVSRRIRRWGHPARLGVRHRTSPFSEVHGFDRGTPVDRYYIERFLDQHREDIHGRFWKCRAAVTRVATGMMSSSPPCWTSTQPTLRRLSL